MRLIFCLNFLLYEYPVFKPILYSNIYLHFNIYMLNRSYFVNITNVKKSIFVFKKCCKT